MDAEGVRQLVRKHHSLQTCGGDGRARIGCITFAGFEAGAEAAVSFALRSAPSGGAVITGIDHLVRKAAPGALFVFRGAAVDVIENRFG